MVALVELLAVVVELVLLMTSVGAGVAWYLT